MAGKGDAIASGSVLVTTDADKLHSGLKGVDKDVEKWGKGAGSKAGGMFAGGFGTMMKGGIVAGLVMAAGDMLLDSFMAFDEKVGHIEDFADNIGMSMEKLQGLSHAADIAGVDISTLESGLQRFRLGVEGPLDTALEDFAEKLAAVEDPGERARMLVEAFGKSGVKMGTMFANGAEGLKKMQAEAEALGIVVSKEQAQATGAAADAVNNVKKSVKGLATSFLANVAPMIQGASEFATKFVAFLKPAIDWFVRLWTQEGKIIALVWGEVVKLAVEAGEWIRKSFAGVFDWTGELPTVEEVVVKVFRNMGIAASYVWDTIKAGAGVVAWIAGQMVKQFGFVVEVFRRIIDLAKLLPDKMRPDWLNDMIKGVKDFEDSVKGTGDKLIAWGEGAWAGFGNTAKIFNAWLDKALVKTEKAAELAKPIMKPPEEPAQMKFTGALLKNSAEAYSVVLKNQMAKFGAMDTDKKMLKETEKIRKGVDKADDKLDKIGKGIKDIGEW